MKRIASFFTVLSLLITLGTDALATSCPSRTTVPYQNSVCGYAISLRYTYTRTISAGLSFEGNCANCSGTVVPSGNYNASITVTLYKQNGSHWDYVMAWFGSSSGGNKVVAGGSVNVENGTFKVVASGNIGGKEFPSKSIIRTKN